MHTSKFAALLAGAVGAVSAHVPPMGLLGLEDTRPATVTVTQIVTGDSCGAASIVSTLPALGTINPSTLPDLNTVPASIPAGTDTAVFQSVTATTTVFNTITDIVTISDGGSGNSVAAQSSSNIVPVSGPYLYSVHDGTTIWQNNHGPPPDAVPHYAGLTTIVITPLATPAYITTTTTTEASQASVLIPSEVQTSTDLPSPKVPVPAVSFIPIVSEATDDQPQAPTAAASATTPTIESITTVFTTSTHTIEVTIQPPETGASAVSEISITSQISVTGERSVSSEASVTSSISQLTTISKKTLTGTAPIFDNNTSALASMTSAVPRYSIANFTSAAASSSYPMTSFTASVSRFPNINSTTAAASETTSVQTLGNLTSAAVSVTTPVASYPPTNSTPPESAPAASVSSSFLVSSSSPVESATTTGPRYSLASLSSAAGLTSLSSASLAGSTSLAASTNVPGVNYSLGSLSSFATSVTTAAGPIVITSGSAFSLTVLISSMTSLTTAPVSSFEANSLEISTASVPVANGTSYQLPEQASRRPELPPIAEKRQLGVMVTATISGHVVTWRNSYSPTGPLPWSTATIFSEVSESATKVTATIYSIASQPSSSHGTTQTSVSSVPVPSATSSVSASAVTFSVPSLSLATSVSTAEGLTSSWTSSVASAVGNNTITGVPGALSTSLLPFSTVLPAPPTPSCSGLPGSIGYFTINFDDLPTVAAADNTTDYAPMMNPYHKLFWSDGFSYAPKPKERWVASSQPHLGIFNVNGDDNVHSSNFTGTVPSDEDVNGLFGSGVRYAEPAFWFDVISARVGCGDYGTVNCDFRAHGYKYDTLKDESVLRIIQNFTILPCTTSDCQLVDIAMGADFVNLTALQFVAYQKGSKVPIGWLVDDIGMHWSNNTCDAVALRDQDE